MVHFGEFLKTWRLRSNSVTRQVSFNRTKIVGKCQNKWILMTKFQILTHKPKIDKWIFGQNIDFWNSVLMLCLRKPCIFALVTVVHQSISFSAALFATSRELTSSPLLQKLHLLLLQTRIRKSDIPVDTDYNLEQHKRRRTAAKKSRFVTKVVISAD